MPRFYAADLDIRLKVCSLKGSTTEFPCFTVGQELQSLLANATESFGNATTLAEQPLRSRESDMILQFLGHRENLPFRIVTAGHTADPIVPSSVVSRSLPMPPPPAPRRKALFVSVSMPLSSIRRLLPSDFPEKPSLKIEAFHNGALAGVHVVAFKHLNNAPETTFTLSGRRVSTLHEKAWTLVLPSRVLPSWGTPTREESTKRWNDISAALGIEARARNCNEQGLRPPSGDFLCSLAQMEMPDAVAKCYVPDAPVWAALDVVVTIGFSKRQSPNNPFVTAPRPFPDFAQGSKDSEMARAAIVEGEDVSEPLTGMSLEEKVQTDDSHATLSIRGHTEGSAVVSSGTLSRKTRRLSDCTTYANHRIAGTSSALDHVISERTAQPKTLTVKKVSFSKRGETFKTHIFEKPRLLVVADTKHDTAAASLAVKEPSAANQMSTIVPQDPLRLTPSPQENLSDSSPLSSADSSVPTPHGLSSDTLMPGQAPANDAHTTTGSSYGSDRKLGHGFAGKQASLKPSNWVNLSCTKALDTNKYTTNASKRRKLRGSDQLARADAIASQDGSADKLALRTRTARAGAIPSGSKKGRGSKQRQQNQSNSRGGHIVAGLSETPGPRDPKSRPSQNQAAVIPKPQNKTSRRILGVPITPEQRDRLAFEVPELSRNSVLSYVGDDDSETMGIRQVPREKHGWFHEEEFVLGVRYILPPGAGMDSA